MSRDRKAIAEIELLNKGGIYVDASDVNASIVEALSGVCCKMLETKGCLSVLSRDQRL